MPGIFVSASRNSNCQAAVAAMMRARPRSQIARPIASAACSAAILLRELLSGNTFSTISHLYEFPALIESSGIIQNRKICRYDWRKVFSPREKKDCRAHPPNHFALLDHDGRHYLLPDDNGRDGS